MSDEIFLETLVRKPSWKELLYELIETNKLDPWNIDIVELADGFARKIKEMKHLELTVPANIILAAAILLKHKSAVLVWEEPAALPETIGDDALPLEELLPLSLASRLMPRRQITAEELVQEMERIIRYDVERPKIRRGGIDTIVELPLTEVDMERKMEEVLGRVKELQDSEGWTTFSCLMGGNEQLVPYIMALLHLAHRGQVDLRQDEFFGEIFVQLLKPKREAMVAAIG